MYNESKEHSLLIDCSADQTQDMVIKFNRYKFKTAHLTALRIRPFIQDISLQTFVYSLSLEHQTIFKILLSQPIYSVLVTHLISHILVNRIKTF